MDSSSLNNKPETVYNMDETEQQTTKGCSSLG